MKNKDLPEGNTHYVDNEQFQQLMVERKALVDSVLSEHYDISVEDVPFEIRRDLIKNCPCIPKIPEVFGDIILKIATNLQFHHHFIRCPEETKDGMIFNGVENCLKYFDNYNSDMYKNPFAYFTQVCYWAALRCKQMDMKKAQQYNDYRSDMIHRVERHDNIEFQNAVIDDFWKEPDVELVNSSEET